ncbi:unnamed protein product [Lactuca virosa]|uniref:Uncharacterized protein n=1 Tax=Lactuca virosa TaxID=75947 RepID=A0AAU9N813_9ASTR|nr:unnamed protein product [Lactuca virosa]
MRKQTDPLIILLKFSERSISVFLGFQSIGISNSVNSMEGGGEANDGDGAITDGLEVDGSDDVTINIWCSGGIKFVVQVSLDSSVESFKSVIAKNCDVPAEQQRLVYKGRLLKDDRTLRSYDLEAEQTVHLVRRLPPATVDLSEFTEYQQIQQPEFQNLIRIGQSMLELLSTHPEALRNVLMNSPRFRELMKRKPAYARIFSDPVIFGAMAEFLVIRELAARVPGGGGTPRHPAVTDRSAPPVGLGGLAIPGLEQLFHLPSDPIARNQIMQNPTISQLTQDFLSNPQNMNMLLNPRFGEIMQTPVLTSQSQLTSPETMQKRMALHQSPSYLLGEQQSTRGESQTSGDTGTQSQPLMDTFNGEKKCMLVNNAVGPEEVYASELAQLQAMGFHDTNQNLEALTATKGNILAAVDRLRGGQ